METGPGTLYFLSGAENLPSNSSCKPMHKAAFSGPSFPPIIEALAFLVCDGGFGVCLFISPDRTHLAMSHPAFGPAHHARPSYCQLESHFLLALDTGFVS